MISPSELAAIRARAEAATKGPCHVAGCNPQHNHVSMVCFRVRDASGGPIDESSANLRFWAASHADVPALLTDATECRALIAEMVEKFGSALSLLEQIQMAHHGKVPFQSNGVLHKGNDWLPETIEESRAALSRAREVGGEP